TVSVLVTDELSGRPVPGATVLVSDATAGTAIGATVPTDPNGFATLPLTGSPATVNVSAFSEGFGYLTIANYATAGSRFLSMPLRRNPIDQYGGGKGEPHNTPS